LFQSVGWRISEGGVKKSAAHMFGVGEKKKIGVLSIFLGQKEKKKTWSVGSGWKRNHPMTPSLERKKGFFLRGRKKKKKGPSLSSSYSREKNGLPQKSRRKRKSVPKKKKNKRIPSNTEKEKEKETPL